MVSEFLCECHGHLKLTHEQALQHNIGVNNGIVDESKIIARVIIHPGANDDGYWTNEHVAQQLRDTVIPIFNVLHPECIGLFAFDNSSNHGCYAPDALLTRNLNIKDGGAKCNALMRPTTFGDPPQQQLMQINGIQKGLKRILEERGIYDANMLKADMIALLDSQPDFAGQKSWLEEICINAGHLSIFFPKFHCEFNWIERYWGEAKKYVRSHCDYTFQGLKEKVPEALDRVSLSHMRKYARKCFRYMDAYRNREGTHLSLKQIEWAMKKYSSHRRILTDFNLDEVLEACPRVN
jgi:hypothetical protein